METKRTYWFHAKDAGEGIGWSGPASWQGWLVLAGYFALVAIAGGLLLPVRFGLFMGTVALLSALLIGVCLAKGEPASAHRRWLDPSCPLRHGRCAAVVGRQGQGDALPRMRPDRRQRSLM